MALQPNQTKQERYHQTDKGKIAQRAATANYKSRMVKWETLISPELSATLDRAKPKEMSRSTFIKKIFQQYLDIVYDPDI